MDSSKKSKEKIESQRSRLAEAITNGRLYQTKMILTDFMNLNYLDEAGLSPLMRVFMLEDAKHRTRSALARLLIRHKVDVNLRDKFGRHALNWACKMNKLDLVELLLEKCLQDVDITSRDLDGNTPLIYAVINNNIDMVNLLVNAIRKFSLSVDQRNQQDKTAYLTALEKGFTECARILAEVGKASREITVNPFLEFLNSPNTESSRKIRVRSAPLVNEYDSREEFKEAKTRIQELQESRKHVNGKSTLFNKSLFERSQLYFSHNKKRASNLLKSKKVHSDVSQKVLGKSSKKIPQNAIKQSKKQSSMKQSQKVSIQEGAVHKQKENLNTSNEKANPISKKKNQFLRLLLDQSESDKRSPSISGYSTSCNEVINRNSINMHTTSRPEKRRVIPTVNGYFTGGNMAHQEKNEFSPKNFPTYHSYLVWRASLDYPPNTVGSFLALQAEQGSDSYRKGIVIPKYDPTSEESVSDKNGGATSPMSEGSGKSEAGRKLAAVAKTVGLSIYLTNKQKKSVYKRDLCA